MLHLQKDRPSFSLSVFLSFFRFLITDGHSAESKGTSGTKLLDVYFHGRCSSEYEADFHPQQQQIKKKKKQTKQTNKQKKVEN